LNSIFSITYCFSSPTSSTSRFHENHFLSLQRLRKDERDIDVDEENWFNDDADENRISSLNHGTLFNNNSDDDDSQPETTSAISTSEPPKSRHSLSDNDEDEGDEDDDDRLPTSSRSHYNKPVISIHIGRSLSTALEGETSSPSSSQVIESSSPYAMVKSNRKKKKKLFIFLFRVQHYRVLLINIMMMMMMMMMMMVVVVTMTMTTKKKIMTVIHIQ
jgi:hypothetical protein